MKTKTLLYASASKFHGFLSKHITTKYKTLSSYLHHIEGDYTGSRSFEITITKTLSLVPLDSTVPFLLIQRNIVLVFKIRNEYLINVPSP